MRSVIPAVACPSTPATSLDERPRSASADASACRASCGVTFGPIELATPAKQSSEYTSQKQQADSLQQLFEQEQKRGKSQQQS
jgi:hypothetical protein